MRLLLLVVGLAVTAASVAHSHDEVVFPELPIPEIDQLFPVEDMAAAFRWADRPLWTRALRWRGSGTFGSPDRWHVVALSEGQFRQVDELLAGTQQTQNTISDGHGRCEGLDGRFGVYLSSWSQGGVDNEFLWTFGTGLSYISYIGWYAYPNHLLKNRFSVAGGGLGLGY